MAATQQYDLIVIGAGSGGVRCARFAARLGARVLCVEGRFWGGTCVNVGCVPKKLYVMAAEYSGKFALAESFGWEISSARLEWSRLKASKDAEITRLSSIYEGILRNNGVDRVWGTARFKDTRTVMVGDQVYQGRHIVIATGGQAVRPDFPGAEAILDSDGFFELPQRPASAIVIGGGYIATELAGILHGAGTQVTLVYRGQQILRGFDDEVRQHVQQALVARGIKVLTDTRIRDLVADETGKTVTFNDGVLMVVDQVFAATGRIPATAGLDLAAAGIATDALGGVIVNDHFETTAAGVYAIGDVIHRKQLTPVALAEGMFVANHLFGGPARLPDYRLIPTAVFCQPEVGTVGLTETECREIGRPFRIYRSRFKPMSHSFLAGSGEAEKVLLKLLVDDESDQVLGIHMVGEHAGEIIQGFAAAMTCGATKAQLDATLGIHPTIAEEFVTLRDISELVIP